jgi:lysophospholipase L1-like esterase
MSLKVQSGETILFIGDSITDCGRMNTERPLGNGYVKQFRDLLVAREPAKDVTIINKGISGHTVVDLRNRWTDDVLREKPDWLSIKIGINDLHRTLANTPQAVPATMFAQVYDDILARTKKALPKCRILLIDPFYISTDRAPGSFRAQVLDVLPKYLATVHRMNRKYRTRLVQTHAVYQKLLKFQAPDLFCGEPVHPNLTGHLVIAEAVYEELSR